MKIKFLGTTSRAKMAHPICPSIHLPPLGFLRIFKGSGGMLPLKILKMEPLRLAKNAFPAYSYCHEVS